ncbi:serine/threonine protein kinase [Nocardiopsis changdeensis]|uniref:non-specific serine/threonine protein kinase n=1 Tax=Nocardiopsis changdeensis TaxID=2831969 RepID=A0ABX8BD09_9ACTN|nr:MULTISPECIES: serine/threonine-protein kinase [Nocardiopsis]QUX20134.1 serine/threonine protein kinase [Nocardiopsis changdeensis]QYX36062.1 serine/threonine protein kinase [Nocardiopsis sp. MT53]
MGPLESTDPDRIGRYRLIARLGAGGMGQVFLGRSAGGRAVAIKRIHPHMATDAAFRERFAREVNAARQVSGAFTAPVIDAGPEDEVPWLVTSYVPSLPLDDAVAAHGPLPEPTVRVLAAGLAEALAEIHRVGLIHRDLKPGNVLLAEDGPRVIDFGIARATDGTAATQSIIGTPGFMSPEQVQGETLTPASDLFAYGAVLAYAAGGTGPFGEGAMPTMVMRIISSEPDLSRVPESLRHLVAACLSKDVRGRPTPGEILDYLGEVPAGAAWLPPAVMAGVQEQVATVNRALSSAEPTGAHGRGEGSADPTRVWGAVAGGAAGAAAGAWGDDAATRVTPPAAQDQGATSVLGQGQGQGYAPTQQYGAGQAQGYDATQQAQPYGAGQGHDSTRRMPAQDQGYGSGASAPNDPYADLYGGRRGAPGADAEELRRREYERHQEQLRAQQERQEQERRRQEEYAAQQRRRHEEQVEHRRRQEADRAHRERVRAEQEAARRAQAEAREAGRPSLWSFAKLLPLLILPFIQIPLGYGAALAWEWFTTETDVWNGSVFVFEPLSMDGFWHATMLGYFILNNLVSLEFLVRSLRTSFVTGAVLALGVMAATNGLLYSFGFWG